MNTVNFIIRTAWTLSYYTCVHADVYLRTHAG